MDTIYIEDIGWTTIYYSNCCRTWPIVNNGIPVGRCGICGETPQGYYDTLEEAQGAMK
jgi:hypothetical protein